MICQEAKEKLHARADGELTLVEERALEEHLSGCPSCTKEAERIARFLAFVGDRLGRLRESGVPDLAFLEEREPAAPAKAPAEPAAPREPRSLRIPAIVPVLAVVAILGVAGWLVFGGGGGEETGEETAGAPERPERPAPSEPRVREPDRPAPGPSGPDRPAPGPGRRDPPRPVAVRPGIVQLVPRLLRSPSNAVLAQIWAELAESPEDAASLRTALERADDVDQQGLLVLALAGAARQPAVRDALLGVLEGEGSPALRGAAAAALAYREGGSGRVNAWGALSVPVGPIESPDVRDRLLAAAETERDAGALGVLIRALGPSQGIDPTITDRFFELARGEIPEVRDAAIEAIRLGRPREPRLLFDLVYDPGLPAESRARLVEAAAFTEPAKALENLREILGRADADEVKAAAVAALRREGSDAALELAKEILFGGEGPAVRGAALDVMASDSTEETLVLLQGVAEGDRDPGIRAAAGEAAKRLAEEIESRKEDR